MANIQVEKDLDAATISVTAQFQASPQRVWQVWADPRQLERWWGPEQYPATVRDHNLKPGGTVTYHMTSPEGERFPGWWRVVDVDEPNSFVVQDGFGESPDEAEPGMPVNTMEVNLERSPAGGTVMRMLTRYSTREDLEKVLEMGMEEGIRSAAGQLDALLRE